MMHSSFLRHFWNFSMLMKVEFGDDSPLSLLPDFFLFLDEFVLIFLIKWKSENNSVFFIHLFNRDIEEQELQTKEKETNHSWVFSRFTQDFALSLLPCWCSKYSLYFNGV